MKNDIKTLQEMVASEFHRNYELLAPKYGYETRKESAVAWSDVPDNNKRLMTAVVAKLISDKVISVVLPSVWNCNCHCIVPTYPTFRANQHVKPCIYADE